MWKKRKEEKKKGGGAGRLGLCIAAKITTVGEYSQAYQLCKEKRWDPPTRLSAGSWLQEKG